MKNKYITYLNTKIIVFFGRYKIIRNTNSKYFFLYLLTVNLLFTGCSDKNEEKIISGEIELKQEEKDTIYNLHNVRLLAGKASSDAEIILDSIERKAINENYSTIPSYKIAMMRAYIASRKLRPRLALRYLDDIFYTEELQNDPESFMFVTKLMSNEYLVLNKNSECIRYALLCIDKAKEQNDFTTYARMLVNLQYTYFHFGQYDSNFTFIRKARKIYDEHPLSFGIEDQVWIREVEGNIHYRKGKYNEAIRLNKEILELYQKVSYQERMGTELEKETHLYFKLAQTNAFLALLYIKSGNPKTASMYYDISLDLFKKSPQVISLQANRIILDYLKAAGRYNEALSLALSFQKESIGNDTINNFNLSIKKQLSDIYFGLGDYRRAWQYERLSTHINDSLTNRSSNEIASELATIYETAEHKKKILENEVAIANNRIWLIAMSIGTSSLIIVVMVLWFYSRRIMIKNKNLFLQLKELDSAKNKLETIRALMDKNKNEKNESENQLFSLLEEYMHKEKAFLNADITREQVASALGTNKLYLSNAITENRSQTFGEYLNLMRLEYAKGILLNDLTTKVEVISMMSGFNSVRTFYRLFVKTYHMTPTEFRKTASLLDQDAFLSHSWHEKSESPGTETVV